MQAYTTGPDSAAESERGSTAVIPPTAEERARVILADLCQSLDALRDVLGAAPAAPRQRAVAGDDGRPHHREIEERGHGRRRNADADAGPHAASTGRTGRVPHRGSGDDIDGGWLTTAEAAAHLRKSQSTLAKLRVYGGGPKFYRMGGKSVRYRSEDLDEWASRNSHTNTSEYVE